MNFRRTLSHQEAVNFAVEALWEYEHEDPNTIITVEEALRRAYRMHALICYTLRLGSAIGQDLPEGPEREQRIASAEFHLRETRAHLVRITQYIEWLERFQEIQ